MLVVHIGLVVLMAVETGKRCIIAGIGVAGLTAVPGVVMSARINRKILGVVIGKFGPVPAICGMAVGTLS